MIQEYEVEIQMENNMFKNLIYVDQLSQPDFSFSQRQSSRIFNISQNASNLDINDSYPLLRLLEDEISRQSFVDNSSEDSIGLSNNFGGDGKKQEIQTGEGFVDTTSSKLVAPSHKELKVQEQIFQVEHKLPELQDQKILIEFENFFTQKKIKGGFKKNTNIPKFIVRLFMKHFKTYAKKYNSQALLKHHKKVKKQLSSRSSNNYTISDVLAFFRDTSHLNEQVRKFNQQIMAEIISQNLNDQVVENEYIKNNKKSYMLAMKIYAYRCRSKTLSERVKIF